MILWGVSMQTIFRDVEAKHWAEQLGLSSLHLHCFVCCYFWLVCLFIFNAVTSRMATSCCRALLAQAVVHKLLPPYRIGTVVPVVLTQVMSPCPSLCQLTPYKCNSAICADRVSSFFYPKLYVPLVLQPSMPQWWATCIFQEFGRTGSLWRPWW